MSIKQRTKFKIFQTLELLYKHYNNYKINKIKESFKHFGLGSNIPIQNRIINPQYISIGINFNALKDFRIEAINSYGQQNFSPKIIIGDNVSFNTDVHIGCIDRVEIGNNCLFASRIYISDHDHGDTSIEQLKIPPIKRSLFSKGPVIIKDNVWIGEGVAILSGVTIGENSIIATNAVVTRDVPPFSVVGGIPAKIIKHIKIK